MGGKGFEDLEVWKKSKDLAVEIYIITKSFPKEDVYSITGQIRRSSLSIPCNIAEGAARASKKEYTRFLMIALGSCAELKTQLIIASDVGMLAKKQYDALIIKLNEIGRMLKGLERKIKTLTTNT